MVYYATRSDGALVLHAILHDEQITRCADAPVGCFPASDYGTPVHPSSSYVLPPPHDA